MGFINTSKSYEDQAVERFLLSYRQLPRRNSMAERTHEIEAKTVHETQSAMLLAFPRGTAGEFLQCWIPISQIHSIHSNDKTELRKFVISDWILQQKGLI